MAKGVTKNINVDIKVEIDYDYDNEEMVILTPFDKSRKMFYLNDKENQYNVLIDFIYGDKHIKSNDFFGVMDYGRDYWPYHNEWFWGNAAFKNNGDYIAWNIGWGFGNLSHATKNVVFINSKAINLNTLDVKMDINKPKESKVIIDDDKKIFHLEMEIIYDNYTETKVLWINNNCHQVFYKTNGYIIYNNQKNEFKDKISFLEHANNQQ